MVVLASPLIAQTESSPDSDSETTTDPQAQAYSRGSDTASDEDAEDPEIRSTDERSVTPKDATQKNVSPLVKAAKSSKNKKSSARSFTDADLSHTKGKLIVVQGTNVREPEIVPVEERLPQLKNSGQGTAAEAQLSAARRQAEAKALEEQISTLETELRRLESEYYMIEEEDHREVVERQFDEKRKALEDAKEKLSKIRSGGSR